MGIPAPALTPLMGLTRPCLMGIVNITPNSFSDGNQYLDAQAAITHAHALIQQGAAILDLGAEASSFFRPNVLPVPPEEQLHRLLPVIEKLGHAPKGLPTPPSAPLLSLDTRSSLVARAGHAAGAHLINDISAGTHDPAMLPTVAELNIPIVLMHISPGYPAPPTQDDPHIVATVYKALLARVNAALTAGIPPQHILLDPGIGFGKTMADNWRLLAGISELATLGYPLVLGISRKRFLDPTCRDSLPTNLPTNLRACLPSDPQSIPTHLSNETLHPRDHLTALLSAWAEQQIPSPRLLIHRIHNVALTAWATQHL